MSVDHSNLFHEALVKVRDVAKNGARNTQAWLDVLGIVDTALDKARDIDRKVDLKSTGAPP